MLPHSLPSSFVVRKIHKGMGQAVAERTVLRKKENGDWESWEDVAHRVAIGNSLLAPKKDQLGEYESLARHIAQGSILMSGRHLQHGDETQPNRNQEVFTNCSTSASSFTLFYLLLNGSGVGRSYDDDMILVDWDNAPSLRVVISEKHPDFDYSAHESVRDALHKYGPDSKNVMWFKVPDSREGWAQALEVWEVAAFEKIHKDKMLILDFSDVRPRGAPIAGMQGRPSSGPVPLMNALIKASSLKGSGIPPWKQAMYIDHYFAECVLVGGARRAARMSTKFWKDADIVDFIRVKRPIEFQDKTVDEIIAYRNDNSVYGFLWSSNNSVTVDEEFWKLLDIKRNEEKFNDPLAKHARKVWKELIACSYGDGTGEPGIINVDKLVRNDDGWEELNNASYVGSKKYQIREETELFLKRLSKRAKRKKYNMIVNPCSEISLTVLGGFCVDGDTRILHRDGYSKISELVGKKIEIFNGEEWSSVSPFKTGINQQLMTIEFSDGSKLNCTPYHKFSIKKHRTNVNWRQCEARELTVGDLLPNFRVPNDIIGRVESEAYTYGVFLGDGSIEKRTDSDNNRYTIALYKGKHDLPVSGTRGAEKKNSAIVVTVSHLDVDKLDSLKEERLPDWVFGLDRESTLNFIRGWLDTDGCYHKGIGGLSISMSEENRARDLQLLLRRVGISFASIRKVADVGDVNNFGERKNPLWLVYIPASEASLINGFRVKTDYELDLNHVVKYAKIKSIEYMDGLHDTFCFTEPKKNMGVFGNVLTYQCVIADVVPFHCETLEDAENAFRTATRALIRVNQMDSLYSVEVKRTNRIGVGITGIHEFAWKFFGVGFRDLINPDFDAWDEALQDTNQNDLLNFLVSDRTENNTKLRAAAFWTVLNKFNHAVMEEAENYAKKLGMNVPHTMTTIKPAGTTSKLFGLTEGWHLASMEFYLRWVQFRSDDPLVAVYKNNGYPTKELKTYEGTTIIGFPTAPVISTLGLEDKLVTAGQATPEEQYKWLQLGEQYWIGDKKGNQISYTLKYDPNRIDIKNFAEMFKRYQRTIRCCSVMPQADMVSFEYQPEEAISKAKYEEIARNVREEIEEDIGLEHIDCSSGACPITFRENKEEAEPA